MKRILTIISLLIALDSLAFSADSIQKDRFLRKARPYESNIPIKTVCSIKLPKGYHEGLLVHANTIWVNNGKGGMTWVVDVVSGTIIRKIEPVATFSEGITTMPGRKYWLSDWDEKKLFSVRIEEDKMIKEFDISLESSHPTGIIWNGSYLYVITWTRGVGTKYHLIKMDDKGKVLDKVRIRGIAEPSQLAWDGKNLWISSWFNSRVYKIDINTMERKGSFRVPINKLTGIAWDGKYFWVTGTKEDLYQIEVGGVD